MNEWRIKSKFSSGSEAAQSASLAAISGVRPLAELIQHSSLDTVTTALGQKRSTEAANLQLRAASLRGERQKQNGSDLELYN